MAYKVFISFKNSENGVGTYDKEVASQLYNELIKEGIETFFSNVSLLEFGEAAYKDSIEDALSQCTVLVVLGSKPEYLTSRWIKYEWDSFQQDILADIKEGSIITFLKDIPLDKVPRAIRHYQSFKMDPSVIKTVVSFVKNQLEKSKKSEKIENTTQGEEEFVSYHKKEKSSYTSDYRSEEERLLIQSNNTRMADMPAVNEVMAGMNKDTVYILDVGCAYGYVGRDRFKDFPNVFVVGIDINSRVIEKARTMTSDSRFVYEVMDVESPNFKEEMTSLMAKYNIEMFDIVFGALVIHHLLDGTKFLRNIRKYLSNEGYVILRGSDDGSVVAYHDDGLVDKIITKHHQSAGISDRLNGRKLYYQLFTTGFKKIKMFGYFKDTSTLDFDDRLDIYMERFDYRRNYLMKALEKDPGNLQLKNDLGWMNYALEKLEEKFGDESFWYSEIDYCAIGRKK